MFASGDIGSGLGTTDGSLEVGSVNVTFGLMNTTSPQESFRTHPDVEAKLSNHAFQEKLTIIFLHYVAVNTIYMNGKIFSTSLNTSLNNPGGLLYLGISVGIFDIIVGTIGNLLTIIAFLKNKKLRRNVFNHFIVNLGIVDLLTASCMMPFNVAGYVYMEWPFGNNHVTCAIQAFFYFCCGYTSVVCLLAITMNRFIGIVFPDRYVSIYSTRWATFILVMSWITAPAFLLPSLIMSISNNLNGIESTPTGWKASQFLCTFVNIQNWGPYMQMVRVAFQFLPLLLMVFAYIVIWHKVHQSNKRLLESAGSREYREKIESANLAKTMLLTGESPASSPQVTRENKNQRKIVKVKNGNIYKTPENEPKKQSAVMKLINCCKDENGDSRQKSSNYRTASSIKSRDRALSVGENQRMQREQRLIYVSILIWVTFTILFMPSLIINLLPNRATFSPIVHMAASNVTWLNSCVNPIIYVAVHRRMRREYKKILKRFFGCRFTRY